MKLRSKLPYADVCAITTESGTYSVVIKVDDVSNIISFERNGTYSFHISQVSSDEMQELSRMFLRFSEEIRKRMDHFVDITDDQLRWYVACCRHADNDGMSLETRIQEEICRGAEAPAVQYMNRKELIFEAAEFNEDEENTARRLKESLEDPASLGWPKCQ